MASELTWTRTSDGTHVAAATPRPGDGEFTERSWHVWKLRDRRWVIESVRIDRQRAPHRHLLPPLKVTGTKHGDAYTLREAKALSASADAFLSTAATHEEES